MARYSRLMPLGQDERASLSLMLCSFFGPLNNRKMRENLGLFVQEGSLTPLALSDFFKWSKEKGVDLWPKMHRVTELVLLLEQKGFLVAAGSTNRAPRLSNCYYFMHEFSALSGKGNLWLGIALGAEYIGHQIKKDLVLITGVSPSGACTVGTGLLVAPGIVLTCAHVIDDIEIDPFARISNRRVKIRNSVSDATVDVGVIFLEDLELPSLPDIAFRKALTLEQVVIAGYPSIPRGLSPTVTFQRGEISGRIEQTIDGYPLELFSAIARPGNSGGPVVALDGRVVGVVTRTLERPREDADVIGPMPFFCAVPADVIRLSFGQLTDGGELPWETYE